MDTGGVCHNAGSIFQPETLAAVERYSWYEGECDPEGALGETGQRRLVDLLYHEVAVHFRAIRVVEIQKMEQRSHGGRDRLRPDEIAADIWEGEAAGSHQPMLAWLRDQSPDRRSYAVPEDRPVKLMAA